MHLLNWQTYLHNCNEKKWRFLMHIICFVAKCGYSHVWPWSTWSIYKDGITSSWWFAISRDTTSPRKKMRSENYNWPVLFKLVSQHIKENVRNQTKHQRRYCRWKRIAIRILYRIREMSIYRKLAFDIANNITHGDDEIRKLCQRLHINE